MATENAASGEQNSEKELNYFVDEAGDPVFNRRKQVVVGVKPGRQKES